MAQRYASLHHGLCPERDWIMDREQRDDRLPGKGDGMGFIYMIGVRAVALFLGLVAVLAVKLNSRNVILRPERKFQNIESEQNFFFSRNRNF